MLMMHLLLEDRALIGKRSETTTGYSKISCQIKCCQIFSIQRKKIWSNRKFINFNNLMQQLDLMEYEADSKITMEGTDLSACSAQVVDGRRAALVEHNSLEESQHLGQRHNDSNSTDSSGEILDERRKCLMQHRQNDDRFDKQNPTDQSTQPKIKKKVVMITPQKANSLFPDLDSSASVDFSRRISVKKEPLNRGGILKVNTRIPLDFKKDYMGVLYSPILEKRHSIILSEMEKRDTERCEKWNSLNQDGWDASVSVFGILSLKWEDRLWKGIPHSLRNILWEEIITKNSGFYTNLSAEQRKWLNMELAKKFKVKLGNIKS